MAIPAAIDSKQYRLHADLAEDYLCGPAVLVAIDRRIRNGNYQTRYEPVADTVSGVDDSLAFWDTFSEVEPA